MHSIWQSRIPRPAGISWHSFSGRRQLPTESMPRQVRRTDRMDGNSASASEPNQYSAVIIARDEDLVWGNGVMVDVSGDYKDTEKAIMQAYDEFSEEQNGLLVPASQNGYVMDLNNVMLQPAKLAMRLLELFMLLSVLISLLGLVAMSTYYSEQSTKSIAVRKVFGGTVESELWRSVKDYMVLVGIAALIGIPLAVWFCGRYLERFAYRIEHYGWVIAVAAILGILCTMKGTTNYTNLTNGQGILRLAPRMGTNLLPLHVTARHEAVQIRNHSGACASNSKKRNSYHSFNS